MSVPWSRMHCEKASVCSCIFARCSGSSTPNEPDVLEEVLGGRLGRFEVLLIEALVAADPDRAAHPPAVAVELRFGHVDAVVADALGVKASMASWRSSWVTSSSPVVSAARVVGHRGGGAAVEGGHVGRGLGAATTAGREHHHGRHAQEGSA